MTPGVDNPRCQACGLCRASYFPFTFPTLRGPLVFIKSQPDEDEALSGMLGTSRVGLLLQKYVIGPLKLKPSEYSLMTAVLCLTPKDKDGRRKKPSLFQARMCRPFIGHLLSKLKGERRIVAMGASAAQHMLQRDVKIEDEVGETHKTPFGDITVTYDPAIVLTPDLEEGGIKLGYLTMLTTHVRRFVKREKNHVFPKMRVV